MKNKTKIIIGSTGIIVVGASIATPIMLLNKKKDTDSNSNEEDKIPKPVDDGKVVKEEEDKKNEVELLPKFLKSAISNLTDDQMKLFDDQDKVIPKYNHDVFKEGFTKEYALNKIKDKLLKSVPHELKDKLSIKNIKIELNDLKDNGHIKVTVLDNNEDIIAELNLYGYKYIEEFVLDEFFNGNLRKAANFSKNAKDNEEAVKNFIDNHEYMNNLNGEIYKNPSKYIASYELNITDNEIKIIFKTLNNRLFSYSLKGFDGTPGVSQIKTNINANLDLGDLKNADGNTFASDITTNNVLDILKNQLKDTEAESLLESMENDFELVANDKDGTLNIKFYFQNDVIEWNVTEFLKFSNDTEIKTSNVDSFILHPKAYMNASTIKTKVFEGKTIPDGFAFPKTIKNIEKHAFYNTTFAGAFTLPEGILKVGESIFENSIFNANVTLPDSIEDIGEYTFVRSTWNNNAFLTKLPKSLKTLYGSSLSKNTNSTPIPLAPDFTLENTMLERIENDGNYDEGAFNGYQLPANFKLPDTIKYIGKFAFKDADFSLLPGKRLVIPNHGVEIHPESGLEKSKIVYTSSAKMTRLTAFWAEEFLKDQNNPAFSNLATIGSKAFEGKTIPVGFVFPKTIENIEKHAFHNTTFAGAFTLPEGITKLGESSFDSAIFNANVALPDSIKDIGEYTFVRSTWNNNAFLTKLPDSLKKLYGSSLSKDTNSTTIPLAPNFTLENTMLERIENDGKYYDEGAFNGYQLPANFKLPDTIKYIGKKAFNNADFSLLPGKKLVIPNHGVEIHPESGLEKSKIVYTSSAKMTRLTAFWAEEFLKDQNNPAFSNLATIGSKAFEGKTIPVGFVFPKTIENIEHSAFERAIFAGTFTLPEGILKMGEGVFEDATFNADVTLPDSIEDIGNFTFARTIWKNGAVLTKLPDSLKVLYGGSLEKNNEVSHYDPIPLAPDFTLENTKLEKIEDEDKYDEGTFNGYQLPANFKLPDTIKYIGKKAFKNADFSLLPDKKLVIPNYDVEIHPESGLTDDNMIFTMKTPSSQASNAQIRSWLLPENINHKKDDDINTIY